MCAVCYCIYGAGGCSVQILLGIEILTDGCCYKPAPDLYEILETARVFLLLRACMTMKKYSCLRALKYVVKTFPL